MLRFINVRFNCADEFITLQLALLLNSLDRVSRRVESYHLVEIFTRWVPSPSHYAKYTIQQSWIRGTHPMTRSQTNTNTIRFPKWRFQVVFTLFLKCLYLFAINLLPVFTIIWSLPHIIAAILSYPTRLSLCRSRNSCECWKVLSPSTSHNSMWFIFAEYSTYIRLQSPYGVIISVYSRFSRRYWGNLASFFSSA